MGEVDSVDLDLLMAEATAAIRVRIRDAFPQGFPLWMGKDPRILQLIRNATMPELEKVRAKLLDALCGGTSADPCLVCDESAKALIVDWIKTREKIFEESARLN
jgi:hypothetical protein